MQAARLVLADSDRSQLQRVVRAASAEQRQAFRSRIVLGVAVGPDGEGRSNVAVAQELRVTPKTVGKWRARFLQAGEKGLRDAPRSGRPSKTDAVQRCEIVALACTPTPTSGTPALAKAHDAMEEVIGRLDVEKDERERLSGVLEQLTEAARDAQRGQTPPAQTDWTASSLHQAVIDSGIACLSRASVWRIIEDVDLRPHRHQGWLHSPDPDFKSKVTEICDLYLHPPLGATVVCIDEKPQMQALHRAHSGSPGQPGRLARREFEYERLGTRCLLAGFEVHTGQVFARVTEGRTAAQTVSYMDEFAAWRPQGEIHVVWDNLNTHLGVRWEDFNQRHGGRFHFHFTPLHASWVNQVECFFSIFTRRVLRHGDFCGLEDFDWKVRTFLAHWNATEAHPFRWTFTGYPLQVGT
jgi:transposase